jgi:hypothetical protein
MGTGKTIITLTHVLDNPEKTLNIAPLRVSQLVWRQEASDWEHTQGMNLQLATGNAATRATALERDADMHLINIENVQWLMANYDLTRWDRIIFDELSLWKGGGKRWKVIRKLLKHMQRIGLTGTPAANGLLGVWPMAKLIDETMLSRTREQYKRKYFYPTDFMQYDWQPLPFAEKAIFDELKPCIFRIENDKSEMPELVVNPVRVIIPPSVHKLMDRLTRHHIMELDGKELTAASAGVLTGKLQQISNGRVYEDDSKESLFLHDAKLNACVELVDELMGEPVIIAYTYQHDLIALREAFPDAPVIGEDDDNEALMNEWNEGKVPVMLGHPGAFGHGLNLQHGGHTLIWYGLNWNLDYFDQTIARLWRSGQRSDSVFIHVLIGADTIDETIFTTLHEKADVQRAMLDWYR